MSTELSQLNRRDVIITNYGFDEHTMIIKANNIDKQYIVVTMPQWLKSSSARLYYKQLEERGWVSAGRYSKFRWLLKF